MATKENPGEFDCYANAAPNEPMFVLLARDVSAPEAVRYWCLDRIKRGKNSINDPQITEAYQCARSMEAYRAQQEEALKEAPAPATPAADIL